MMEGRLLRGLAFVVILVALSCGFAVGQTRPSDVEGWQRLKWGMSEKEVRAIFGSQIVELPPNRQRKFMDGDVADLAIESYQVGPTNFRIEFKMDPRTRRLNGVSLDKTAISVSPDRFYAGDLLNALIQKYGQPNNRKLESGDETYAWNFKSTTIRLVQFRTSVMSMLFVQYLSAANLGSNKL